MNNKYIERNVPETIYVKVNHFHVGNSSNRMRNGKPFLTVCKLLDRETGQILAVGKATCSKSQPPERSIGRSVAVGRALKNLHGAE